MAIYLVEHQHTDSTCPAQSPDSAKMMEDLVLGKERLDQLGVRIVEDCKVKGEHRLLILVDASARQNVEKYAEPFKMVGSTEVHDLTICGAFLEDVLTGSAKGCR
ncbi:MAG TPA: hypothetical protein VN739_04975 [Nitrososphaerales archaeon]|nr:hypothetical protein [Nitrososphaerales archaeon]